MPNRTTGLLVLLTFVGMVGIYVGLYLAWQKYQQYSAQLQGDGGGLVGLINLLKS